MFAIAFLIVTCVIGAGFATGAELVAFFGKLSLPPLVVSAIASVFIFLIIALITVCTKPRSYTAKRNFSVSSVFFIIIYFIMLTAMTAGVSQITGIWTTAVSLVFCLAVVCFGFEKMLFINKYLTFFIVIFLTVICSLNLKGYPAATDMSGLGRGLIMAALYAGMNCCTIVAVVAKAREKQSRGELLYAAALACCIIFLLITLVMTAIQNNTVTDAMPILALSGGLLSKATVLACIITSQFVTLFNIAELSKINRQKTGTKLAWLIGICLAAFGGSFFGFINILGIFYPAVGAGMLVYIIWIFADFCFFSRHTRARQSPDSLPS